MKIDSLKKKPQKQYGDVSPGKFQANKKARTVQMRKTQIVALGKGK